MAAVTRRVGLDLTVGSVPTALVTYAIPVIITSMIQQLYSMVDLMVIGRFVGSVGTVAVSTGSELSDFLTMLAVALASAGQIYIAQLTGAKDSKRIRDAIGTLFTVTIGLMVLFTVGAVTFHRFLLDLINCPPEAYGEARNYLVITACGLPFIFGYNAICSVLRGMGESRRPMYFVLVAAIVNIFLDILLVAVFDLSAAGTAIATVASQAGAFLAAFLFLYKNRAFFNFELSRSFFRIDRHAAKVMLKIGIPQLIRSFSVQGSMMWVKSQINIFGVVPSATYSIGNKVEKCMNLFIFGMTDGASSMIGQNLGARKLNRVHKTIFTTLGLTLAVGLVSCVLFLTIPKPLYALFTKDQAVIEFGVTFLRIMAVACAVVPFSCTFKPIATGAGAAVLCFVIGVLDGVCRIAVCILFRDVFHQGAQSFFWGAALCMLVPGLVCLGYYLSGKWKTKKLLSEE